jgi:hypothetical protein
MVPSNAVVAPDVDGVMASATAVVVMRRRREAPARDGFLVLIIERADDAKCGRV